MKSNKDKTHCPKGHLLKGNNLCATGYGRRCRICYNEWMSDYRKQNPDAVKSADLKKLHGITLENYNKMFSEQEGYCAICGRHQVEFKKKLAVDHSHKTGDIRGLLCQNCNTSLGGFQDDIEILKRAIKYLKP